MKFQDSKEKLASKKKNKPPKKAKTKTLLIKHCLELQKSLVLPISLFETRFHAALQADLKSSCTAQVNLELINNNIPASASTKGSTSFLLLKF